MAEQPCYFFYGKSLVEVELTAGAPAVPELEPPPMATSTFALMVLTLSDAVPGEERVLAIHREEEVLAARPVAEQPSIPDGTVNTSGNRRSFSLTPTSVRTSGDSDGRNSELRHDTTTGIDKREDGSVSRR